MHFLVDECTGPAVVRWLREQGHDVCSVYDDAQGSTDDEILRMAQVSGRVLITCDKDFGEMVYRDGRPHPGIILLRLQDERAFVKIEAIDSLLCNFPNRIANAFVVVTETQVRFGQT